MENILIPADIPEHKHDLFYKNYSTLTRDTGRLFLFSCDHKIEHLNADFYGAHIHPHAVHPEHMFRIAHAGDIGAMATHYGLITRYALQYPSINYVVKMNASVHFQKHANPYSALLCTIDDIITLKNNNNLSIPGIGITVYLGNEYETELIAQAAHIITQAHREGLVAIAWIYIRGETMTQENDPELIAGAAGVGLSLGADFIKIKLPAATETATTAQNLKIACAAAGNSKVIYSGGEKTDYETYLKNLCDYMQEGDVAGTATGRNIFQLALPEAIAFTHAIAAIVYKKDDYKTAHMAYQEALEKRTDKTSP